MTPKKGQRDLGLPAEAFEVSNIDSNCCIHCEQAKLQQQRPQTVPGGAYRGVGVGRPQSRGSGGPGGHGGRPPLQRSNEQDVSEEEMLQAQYAAASAAVEATITIDSLPGTTQSTTTTTAVINRGHRISALEVVEEERTPGTTPSPSSYLPDIHQNQKVL